MTKEQTATIRCEKETRDNYLLFKIQSKAKNLDEVLKKALKLLKEEFKLKWS